MTSSPQFSTPSPAAMDQANEERAAEIKQPVLASILFSLGSGWGPSSVPYHRLAWFLIMRLLYSAVKTRRVILIPEPKEDSKSFSSRLPIFGTTYKSHSQSEGFCVAIQTDLFSEQLINLIHNQKDFVCHYQRQNELLSNFWYFTNFIFHVVSKFPNLKLNLRYFLDFSPFWNFT